MNQLATGEASEADRGNTDLQKELAEVLRQRAAISAVLRAIASSPHDLQPMFNTILDSAVHLCRAQWGAFRLSEEIGFRLVAYKLDPAVSEWVPPKLLEHGSFLGRLYGSKTPVHIPDLATHHELNSAGVLSRAKPRLRPSFPILGAEPRGWRCAGMPTLRRCGCWPSFDVSWQTKCGRADLLDAPIQNAVTSRR